MRHSPKSEYRIIGHADSNTAMNSLRIAKTESWIRLNEACGLDNTKHVKYLTMLKRDKIELENVYNQNY